MKSAELNRSDWSNLDVRIRPGAFLIVILLVLVRVASAQSEKPPGAQHVDTVNYFLGTQTIGIKYKFTGKTSLVETAERIREMGSGILKFSMCR